MRALVLSLIAVTAAWGSAAAQNAIAPTGTLRAIYLASNPAQAVRTGNRRNPRRLGRSRARTRPSG